MSGDKQCGHSPAALSHASGCFTEEFGELRGVWGFLSLCGLSSGHRALLLLSHHKKITAAVLVPSQWPQLA